MTAHDLSGRRVLIVGASSGIGRALAVRAVADGAQVAMAARSSDKLAATVEAAGGGTAISADLRRPEECERIVAEAIAAVGVPELVFVSAGSSSLRWIHETDHSDWAHAFETNVIGANLLFNALHPHLRPGAIVAACSSESVGNPRPGLVPYASSKAALEESLRGWRIEHPHLRFTCVTVGATMPTGFGDAWDGDMLLQALNRWAAQGLAQAEMMEAGDVADMLAGTFANLLALPGVGLEHLTLRSPAKAGASNEEMLAWAAERGGPTFPEADG